VTTPSPQFALKGTRKLIGDLFELSDLGAQDLKGVAGPTRAYAALSESLRESRFDALHAGGLTSLVGREEETELLLRRWMRAKAGEGQVAALGGISAEAFGRAPPAAALFLLAAAHRQRSLPDHWQLERAAELNREDDPKTRLDKLDQQFATSTSREDAALLAEMLSLPNDGRYPALDLAPPQRRQRTLEALIAQIEAIARQTPTLMIFEDAHWADPPAWKR